MQRCKETTELATAYADGALHPEARREFEAHLASCPDCRTWVKQLDLTVHAVRSLPPPEVPAELRDRLLRRFDAWNAARAAGHAPAPVAAAPVATAPENTRRYSWEALFAIVGVVALLVGFARNPSRAAGDWIVSMALAAGAMAFAALARRLTLRLATVAVSASFVAALVRGGEGPVAISAGLECLLIEAVAAAGVMGAAWLVNRRAAFTGLGAWAVAGALAGDAALQIACREHLSLAHLATFHAGGVLAIAGVALVATRKRPATA
jgi:anti-sigma factor RsiW